jgi:signal peptidase I
VAIFLVLRIVVFQPYTIPSASMEPNLFDGDYVIGSRFTYGWSHFSIPLSPPLFHGRIFARAPHRGDIVIFRLPSNEKVDYVKRLIGLPGDRIQMKGGRLYLNGQPVKRSFVRTVQEDVGDGEVRPVAQYRETLPGGKSYLTDDWGPQFELDDTPVYVVPQGHYFMMGDNRDNSSDSRVPPEAGGVGYVPAENLEAKGQMVMFAWKPGASIWKPWTWILDFEPGQSFRPLH